MTMTMRAPIAPTGKRLSRRQFDPRKYARLLRKSLPGSIQTEVEYNRPLATIERLMDEDEEDMTPEEGRLLELLSILVEDYDDRNFQLPKSEPHKMLKYLLEERGLKPRDLWPVLGLKSRVSEILSGKRGISKAQAKKLAA